MAIDTASFLQRFPEFTQTNDENPTLIPACLQDATYFCDPVRWGNRYEAGVFCKAAHLVSMHPFGLSARLSKTDAATIYSSLFDDMKLALPVRMMNT
jgi:hypothetical protein